MTELPDLCSDTSFLISVLISKVTFLAGDIQGGALISLPELAHTTDGDYAALVVHTSSFPSQIDIDLVLKQEI